jgi:hypothetical protein
MIRRSTARKSRALAGSNHKAGRASGKLNRNRAEGKIGLMKPVLSQSLPPYPGRMTVRF